MGRVASALDNAAAEAVNSILKTEYIYRNTFTTREHARQAIGRWIDSWYNAARRHGWCRGISPIDYEEQHHHQTGGADGQPAAA
jgi:transposase InsO family protein